MGQIQHKDITVTGRVQGVGFRYSAVNHAKKLGVKGYVKNMYDGSVALEVEGSANAVDLMVNWCKEGPSSARVSDISIYDGEVKGYDDFTVKR